jgi:hypothetical protein
MTELRTASSMTDIQKQVEEVLLQYMECTGRLPYEYKGYDRQLRAVELQELHAGTPVEVREMVDTVIQWMIEPGLTTIVFRTNDSPWSTYTSQGD